MVHVYPSYHSSAVVRARRKVLAPPGEACGEASSARNGSVEAVDDQLGDTLSSEVAALLDGLGGVAGSVNAMVRRDEGGQLRSGDGGQLATGGTRTRRRGDAAAAYSNAAAVSSGPTGKSSTGWWRRGRRATATPPRLVSAAEPSRPHAGSWLEARMATATAAAARTGTALSFAALSIDSEASSRKRGDGWGRGDPSDSDGAPLACRDASVRRDDGGNRGELTETVTAASLSALTGMTVAP